MLKLIKPKKNPEDVFTPRGKLNPQMYTQRGNLEGDLKDKIRRKGHHIVIYGESGCGKTWLYNNYFFNQGIHFKVVNLAHASRNKSISRELLSAIEGDGVSHKSGSSEKKSAEVNAVVAKGTLDHTDSYTISPIDPLRSGIKKFRKMVGPGKAFIVLDNLERIFAKEELMDELADLITLADDPEFMKDEVRFLLVGVPSGVKEYFASTPSHRTIANRIVQIEEVGRLTRDEAKKLIKMGFVDELEFSISKDFRTELINHVCWVTDCIPQSMQEYCLELAMLAESTREVTKELLPIADRKWLASSLSSAYAAIEKQLNERDTKIQRRNQVLYAIGNMRANEFKPQHVEEEIRGIFYSDAEDESIGGIPNAFSDLMADGSVKILKKTPKGDAYMFADPHYRLAIRAMLRLNDKKLVEKISMDDAKLPVK